MARSKSNSGGSRKARKASRRAKAPDAPAPDDHERDAPGPKAARRPTTVALGASAGGLAVFGRFLNLMPTGGGLAFLLVSHLDPSQESLLPELLGPRTALTVVKAATGTLVEADHVYVIPPDRYMTVSDGVIRLEKIADSRGARFPIDVLLRSLAADQKENAVGIIFTGTGADGTDGLRAIKDNGGIVIVQDPETVEYQGMPTSAIATGIVDFVLPVEQMPDVLLGYARHFYTSGRESAGEPRAQHGPAELQGVFSVLKARGDPLDYRAYKTGTVMRRIHRRMGLAQIHQVHDYVELLRTDADEVDRLRKDLLISVTHFFRDAEGWKVLEKEVIPLLFENRSPDAPIRVWVPGCGTGEEAYSIAMLLVEHRRTVDSTALIQVFATDLRADLLEVARAAVYDKSSVSHIPAKHLKAFFREETPNHYRPTTELRETVTFAVQNLLTDPPFSKMDLVSCRNVLIYFRPEAQRKIIGLFHFALKQGGHLFLGGSEGVAPHESEFEPVSRKWRLYRRTGATRAGLLGFPTAMTPPFPASVEPRRARIFGPGRTAQDVGLADAAQRWLADAYAPAAVVIGQRYDIQYIHGAVGAYLELPRGEPVLNLLSMVSPDFRGRLRVALHKARASGEPCEITVTYPNHEETTRVARLSIQAFGESPTGEGLLIVTFADAPQTEVHEAERRPAGSAEEESAVRQLEAELAATKEDLQGTIEALETANEELGASNEETMSMNEEFRSTNEELETSKEELQSLNEELTTVNSELREKVRALEVVTNDLTNLLGSTDIPTLFLDSALHIRRFSSASKRLLSLIPSDLGRPISDIAVKFHDDTLVQDIGQVMSSLAPREKEIRSHAGQRYLRRIRPYRTADDLIDGVVITLFDIETMKVAEDKVNTARRNAEEIVDTLREPLLVLDSRLVVKSANGAYYEKLGAKPDDTVGRSVYSLGGGQWDLPALRGLLEQTMGERVEVRGVELEPSIERLGTRTMLVNSRRLHQGDEDGEEVIILAIEDVTEAKRRRELVEERVNSRTAELERSTQSLRNINESLDAFSHVVGHDLKEPARAVESLLRVLEEDHGTALSPAAQGLLAKAREANERLSRLLVGLLALSRASRIDFPRLKAVGIAAALANETCWTRYQALLVERHASIEPPDPDVFVKATPESLCQILGNLVLNAVKHNPSVEPRIRVSAALAPAGDLVEVVVEDNGKGFPDELVAGFENMSSATRGFGLIIAKRTVENLGGRLWLRQAEGGGGAVHFTLQAPPNAPALPR